MKSDTMWALTYDRRHDWSTSRGLEKIRVPVPVLDEKADVNDVDNVLIRVNYAGFCGSDRGIWFRNTFGASIINSLEKEGKDIRIIGHELLGEVVSAGSRAQKHYRLYPGQTVSAESHIICNRCYQCLHGQTNVCADDIIIGISQDGCFAEYIKLPAQVVWPTDINRVHPWVGAIQEPFGNAVHCSTKVDLRGKTLAVFGCGTIGLFVILIARSLGASRIIGIEPDEQHALLAEKLGADKVIRLDPRAPKDKPWQADKDIVAAVKDLTRGIGADVSMEMSGYNSSINNTIQSTRRGGDVILFGLKSGEAVVQDYDRIIVDGISMHAVIGRELMRTWFITRSLLEDKKNHIQDNIIKYILNDGKDTIVDLESFNKNDFEKRIQEHPKVIFKINSDY